MINVRNQLVGSPFEKDVTIECNVEASPKSINYWIKDVKDGESRKIFKPIYHVYQVYHVSVMIKSRGDTNVIAYWVISKQTL